MTERILIADDSLPVREAAQNALAQRGARVESAADGNQALARLRESPHDLLIADVHMPGLDGYALCRAAKGERSATRVLLLVGTFEPFDSAAATAAHADGVVRKPFVADELRRVVDEVLPRAAAPEPEPVKPPRPAPAEPAVPAPATESPAPTAPPAALPELSDADVDRIARRVLALGGEAVLERVARELLGGSDVEQARRAAAGAGSAGGDPGPG